MKTWLTLLLTNLLACDTDAQTMQVWMKDGSQRQYAVSEIESITFSESTSMDNRKQEIELFLDEWNVQSSESRAKLA